MEAVNQTPFQFAPLPGRLGYPEHSLTVIVKGTFDLVPEAPAGIADEQLPITGDLPYPDDEEGTGSPYYESDLGHFKPQADLLLVGICHAPGGRPRPVCRVTFAVGAKSRALMVVGERQWEHRLLHTAFSDPQPFTEMALRYENSFGGEGFAANPVGKGFAADGVAPKDQPQRLPNVEDPTMAVDSPKSRPEPAGFGPLARTWQPRTSRIGTYGEQWFKTRAPWFPEDMDWAVFNAAPPQMRAEGYLRGDEEIFLENIHPEHAKFHGGLPGLRVRCFLDESRQETAAGEPPPSPAEGPDGAQRFREVPMHLDTLWVDGEAGKLVLVWRGAVAVLSDEYEEVGHLFILSEPVEGASQSVEECQAVFLASLPEPAPETDEMGDPIEPGEAEEPPPPEADSAVAVEDDEELEALLAEMDPKDAVVLKGVLAREEAQMQARMKEAGLDPSKPLPMTPEDEKGLIEKLKQLGVDEEDLEWAVQEPEPLPPLTRELVEERVALGETFEGEDLSGLDLSGLEMKGIDFSKAIFTDAVLKEAKLSEANLSGANLAGVDLSGVDLTKAQLTGADLTGADLSGACLEEVEGVGVRLDGAGLTASRLDGATLTAASMTHVNLDQATAVEADFSGTDLTGASFRETALESANFSEAVLVGVDFAGANLRKATMDAVLAMQVNMEGADLTGFQAWKQADFTGGVFRRVTAHQSGWDQAVLTGADFSYADMQGADFTKASLEGANLSAADVKLGCFRKARLRGAKLVQMNLFNGIMAYADLTEADLRGSNMYGVDFSDAVTERTLTEGTNLKKTKLHPA